MKMKNNQFVIIGLGRFGSSLARELTKLGYEVLGIDKDEEAVHEMSQVLTHPSSQSVQTRKFFVR